MRNRPVLTVHVFSAFVLAASLATVPLSSQTASSETPRTPWGDPDLQGVWSYASLTPLQRPGQFANQEFFTPEQADARYEATGIDRKPPPGGVGAYNSLWFDRGKVDPSLRTSLIIDPPNGRLPPLTPAGKARAKERSQRQSGRPDSWVNFNAWMRCITYHGVPPISTGYNNAYQIFQTPNYVAIRVENIHDVRIIPLDGRPPLDKRIRQWNGSSRGHWEGSTLVVETGNFSDKTEHRYPSSQNLRAVERFTRVDANTIHNEFTIEDPETYTTPWTAVRSMPLLDDYEIYEYACHEGNYSMTNALSGARAEDRAEKELAARDD